MALAAYRQLLRSTRIAFHRDLPVLTAARLQARQAFDSKRGLERGSEEVAKGIQHAEAVADILRKNVVQGEAQGEGQFRLRIHADTERGDNDSVKNAGRGSLSGQKCCSA